MTDRTKQVEHAAVALGEALGLNEERRRLLQTHMLLAHAYGVSDGLDAALSFVKDAALKSA